MECKHCKSQKGQIIRYYKYHDIFECFDCKCWSKKPINSCCRNPNEVFVFKYRNYKAEQIYIQCMNCFGCLNMTKPLPFKMYADKVRGESIFLQKEFDDWKVAKNLEANEIYEVEKHLKFKTSNAYFYLSHLQSNYWRSIRLQVLERDEWLCQSCKQTKAIDVHHLTYKNLGNEELNDLISYCRPCHDEVHNK